MRCTKLATVVLGLSFQGCSAPDSLLEDPQAEDGFRFVRDLAPEMAELGSDYDATVSATDYLAFEFDVPEAQIIRAIAEPGVFTQFWDALDVVNDYQTDIVLFRVDEDADPNAPQERYDYVTNTNGNVLESAFRPMSYRVQSPGRFMALVTATEASEIDELDVTFELRGLNPLNERQPGHIELKVFAGGYPAVGLRVAAGTVETYVDANGWAVLQNVEAGVQTIRFGTDGLGRVYNCGEVDVIGDGETERLSCHVLEGDYQDWTRQ